MKKQCEKDCKAAKSTVSIINTAEMFSTTNYNNYQGGIQKYPEEITEDKLSEKLLELSIKQLSTMVQSGRKERTGERGLIKQQ